MTLPIDELLKIRTLPTVEGATLVLAFSGWMDGGDVSTGTVERLVDLLKARPFAEIDPEPFYIYNFPGPMEVATLFRPQVEVAGGLVKKIKMPQNRFFCHEAGNLILFIGKEPNLHWRNFGRCIFELADRVGVEQILFVGSFGGSVPHTREPRLFVSCTNAGILAEMERFGLRPSDYKGPGSFTNYLMASAASEGIAMTSLVAEIPGYLQGVNPLCIAAVTRQLAKILQLSLDSDALRSASTEWELQVSSIVEQDAELTQEVRRLEEEYDNELLRSEAEEA
ncbi:MAG: PAC2 family protein [Planctomycetaceae bacterium]|nr:PAC2 family protein [Planctomycetaceae bacterium]